MPLSRSPTNLKRPTLTRTGVGAGVAQVTFCVCMWPPFGVLVGKPIGPPSPAREGADGDRQNPGGTSKTKEANASVPRDSMLFAGARIALAKRCVCDPQHSAARHRVGPAWTPALRHIVFS